MKKHFVSGIFVSLVLASLLGQRPCVAAEIDTRTPALLQNIEKFVAAPRQDDELTISNLHLAIARFYIHAGEDAKAVPHLEKITANSDKIDLLQPYAGMLLEAAKRNDPEKAFGILASTQEIAKKILAIRYIKGDYGNHEPNLEIINEELCPIAAKAFAVQGHYGTSDKISTLPQCAKTARQTKDYSLAGMLANGHFKQAYNLISARNEQPRQTGKDGIDWTYNGAVRTFKTCIGFQKPLVKKEDVAFLTTEAAKQVAKPEDNKAFFLAYMLLVAGKTDEAFALAKKLNDSGLKKIITLKVYQDYFLSGNEAKTQEAANLLDIAGTVTGGDNRGGMGHAQWYAGSLAIPVVVDKNPAPFAYKLAMQIRDDRARFKALLSLYTYSKDKEIKFSGCAADAFTCIEKELNSIAARESDDFSRDYMYGRIAALQKDAGNIDAAQATFRKVMKPDAVLCHYDMCFNAMATSPTTAASDCSKNLPQDVTTAAPADLNKIAECHYNSRLYAPYLLDPSLLGDNSDTYFSALAFKMEEKKDYPEMFRAIARIKETKRRHSAIITGWIHVSPLDGRFVGSGGYEDERAENRQRFIDAFFANQDNKDDTELWQQLVNHVVFNYWNGFELRADTSIAEQAAHKKMIWGYVAKFREKKPELSIGSCTPRLFREFPGQCAIQQLVALDQESEALALAAKTLPDEKPLALTSRIILAERFLRESQEYRDATNSGFRFGYTSGNGCPIEQTPKE